MNLETELEVANSIRELLRTKLTAALGDQEAAEVRFAQPLSPREAEAEMFRARGRTAGIASCIEGLNDYITALEALATR